MLKLDIEKDLHLLIFNKEFNLKNLPHIQSSLSHSQEHIGCAYTNQKDTYIGIDIESTHRKMTSEAKRLFSHPQDAKHSNLLELWVKKEAAFKAIFHWQTSQKIQEHEKIQGLFQIAMQDDHFFIEDLNHEQRLGQIALSPQGEEYLYSIAQINLLRKID